MEVNLTPADPNLAELFLEYRLDPVTRKYNPLANSSLDDLRERLSKSSSNFSDYGKADSFFWFIKLRGDTVGQVNLSNINKIMQTAELGYGIATKARGQGIASAAVKQLVDSAFDQTPLRKLIAFVHEDNQASRRVLEKVGFFREGLLRQHYLINGRPANEVLYGILRSDTMAAPAHAKLFLETERLILRNFTHEDAELLIDLDSDPEVMRYITDGKPISPEVIRNEILPRFLRYHEAYESQGFWAAVEKSTGDFLGWFHLRPAALDASQGPELGYRLKRAAWEKGYATEGAKAILHKAFSSHEIGRVIALTMKPNRASAHVMEKIGMRLEKTFIDERFPGAEKTAVQYAITREEFLSLGDQAGSLHAR